MLDALRQIAYRLFPFLDRHRGARQFVKFCVVGLSNVVVDVGIYLALTRVFGWYFLYASLTSFVVAVSWSYYWNRRWTFRLPESNLTRQFPKFVITNVVSGTMQNVVLYFSVEMLGWHDLYGKAIAIVLGTFWNFIVTKFWAFRPTENRESGIRDREGQAADANKN
ncbi:MAG: GtrA family protein [Patescibacteria group bacterium]|nr:GtrA family protein [Patescibacteria group bacterium]